MATCKYCGKDAGWFRDFHDQCKSKDEALQAQRKAKDEALQAQKAADAKCDTLAALSRGDRLTLAGADSFLLQANEELLFVFTDGGYAEVKFKQSGIRRAWFFDQIHQGHIAVTTKRLLFAGSRSVQVAISRIVTVSSDTLTAPNGTVLSGLRVETGAATRKVFVLDDPSFLAQVIDIARGRAKAGTKGRSTATNAPATNAGADLGVALASAEKGLWTGIVSPFMHMVDLVKSTPGAALQPESLVESVSDIASALVETSSLRVTVESFEGKVAWATEALAAVRGCTRILELLRGELDRLARLGRAVKAADLGDIEPDIVAAYIETIKQIKRLDPGFEAAAADWLAQKRRGDSSGARAALRDTTASPSGPQPVGTSITFKVVPAAECPTFAKVGGMADLKLQLRSTIGLVLREREKAAAFGIRFNGVLLYGSPGTGKTFFARACAGEFGCNLLSIGSADIMSAYVGDSPRLVSAAFDTAERNAPIILFFDEFDSIAERRGGGGGDAGGAADRQVLEQLLRNLESIRDRPDVIVMAATNRLDDLDPAIMRPGRFDLKVRVDLPDLEAREAIFEATLRNRKAAAIDCKALAETTEGLSAAAITSLIDSAALAALQRSGTGREAIIEMSDVTEAIASRGGKDRPLTKHASWDNLVLPTSTKQELQKIQVLIQDPARAKQFGVTPPRGVLLYGPPGTGKTSIARVLASETKASFYPMSCADLVSKWWGESERNVAQLFARARENRPSIIFLDEIDAIARKRGPDAGNSGLDRVLNQLLQEIDGLEGAEGIFVLAATNRREIVDEALLRGGRLGRQIYVGLPDGPGRETLLRLYGRDMPLAPDVDLKGLANATVDWSGADLRQLCEQAAMEAMMSSTEATAPRVTAQNFTAALETTQRQRGASR